MTTILRRATPNGPARRLLLAGGISTDIPMLVEAVGNLRFDRTNPLEMTPTLRADRTVPIELAPLQRMDQSVPGEFVSALQINRTVPTEFFFQVALSLAVQVEEAVAQQLNASVPTEFTSSINAVVATPSAILEWIASFQVTPPSIPDEFGSAVLRNSAGINFEILSRVASDLAIQFEALAVLLPGIAVPLEFLALNIAVATNASIPFEFASLFRADLSLPVEFIARALRDSAAQLEANAGLVAGPSAPTEWQAKNISTTDISVPLEAASFMRVTAMSCPPIEWLVNEVIGQRALLEAGGVLPGVLTDIPALIEWLTKAGPLIPPISVSVRPVRILGNEPDRNFDPIEVGEVDNFVFDFTFDVGNASMVSTRWSCVLQRFDGRANDPTPWARVLSTSVQTKLAVRVLLDGTLVIRDGFFSVASIGGMPRSAAGGTYTLEAAVLLTDGRMLRQRATVRCKHSGPLN